MSLPISLYWLTERCLLVVTAGIVLHPLVVYSTLTHSKKVWVFFVCLVLGFFFLEVHTDLPVAIVLSSRLWQDTKEKCCFLSDCKERRCFQMCIDYCNFSSKFRGPEGFLYLQSEFKYLQMMSKHKGFCLPSIYHLQNKNRLPPFCSQLEGLLRLLKCGPKMGTFYFHNDWFAKLQVIISELRLCWVLKEGEI